MSDQQAQELTPAEWECLNYDLGGALDYDSTVFGWPPKNGSVTVATRRSYQAKLLALAARPEQVERPERWMVDYEHGEGEPQHAVLSWIDDEATDLPEVGTYLIRESDAARSVQVERPDGCDEPDCGAKDGIPCGTCHPPARLPERPDEGSREYRAVREIKGKKRTIGEGGEAIHVLASIEGVTLEVRRVGPWEPTTVEEANR